MSYAIIGFGKIGQALAKAFARSGIEVSVATTCDPSRMSPMLSCCIVSAPYVDLLSWVK